ncbi:MULTISPECIES: S-layer homology domain-containing protein [Sporosarcina]|uniref:S-layer homology domain-containing protein n=1 Tax=Sporosarcina TaxID=1569 RepID=UPI00129B3F61|nr:MULTISPECIES: YcdB/YcdC domain-containing protein [Sporosarcina]GKV66957.1 hypothetical protein NCCP2331_31100 [Sporosarcina sp. NCCP-2331]GLB57286.1 hypothetical protein NCCP2378_30740 [Sporosarcina sp. NCCP-2378]
MVTIKKISAIVASSALSIGMFSSFADASTLGNGQPEKTRIQLAASENIFTKEELIRKFHQTFPTQFDFLKAGDFQMNSAHIYQDDETVRYDLHFTKIINGKRLSGNVGFVGEKLEIEYFYYQPATVTDALFPAKVSKEEAGKIANEFITKFLDGKDYQMGPDSSHYYPRKILTEPIRHSFSFTQTKNQVPIADRQIEVTVLGNGEIASFYKMIANPKKSTFDDLAKVKGKEEMIKKVKNHLAVELNYQIHFDYETGEREVRLGYQPTTNLQGIHAVSGEWKTEKGFSAGYPSNSQIEMLAAKPLPPRQDGITIDAAKKIAEQLLATDSDQVKLMIESIQETTDHNGQDIISVQYMYQLPNGGYGSNLEINKQTGEVMQFQSLQEHVWKELGKDTANKEAISKKEALKKAITYAKEWASSYLHHYAMPVTEAYTDEKTGLTYFSFPRVVNGIIVSGDQIIVEIAADGSLNSLNVNYQNIENWPASEDAIPNEKALSIFKESLGLQLLYMKQKETETHYELVYTPVFNGNSNSYLDAGTGEWKSFYGDASSLLISHPWAEEELNYLLHAKVLDVKDVKNFNADASVSKGEALKILMNSLTYFYQGSYPYGQEQGSQTFENIGSKHPLYHVVERAAELGVIKPEKNFSAESTITKEELAVWYTRVLGLEQAAKNGSIYKLNFTDANEIHSDYIGYVAIANSLGILHADKNLFQPKQNVNYAELAASTIRLAHAMAESGRDLQ